MKLKNLASPFRAIRRGALPLVAAAGLWAGGTSSQAQVLSPGWAVGTCYSGGPNGTSAGFVVGQMDTNAATLTGSNNNAVPMYHHATWTRSRLGEIFGVTLDDMPQPNTFVSATATYNSSVMNFNQWPANGSAGDTFGTWQEPGGIYRLDGINGTVCNYARVPNAGSPGKGQTASLGNICFDKQRRMIYVSNLDDGRIYRVAWVNGCPATPLVATAVWDHGLTGRPIVGLPLVADNAASVLTAAGRRVWAVHTFQNRLYYSVWNLGGTTSSTGNSDTEIWSVGLDATGSAIAATVKMERAMPGRTNPITDISISHTGAMVVAERGCVLGSPIDTTGPHSANIFQFRRNLAGNWVPGNAYKVGRFSSDTNAAGGIDVDCDDTIHATGNALALGATPSKAIYGLQIIPSATNPLGNASNTIGNSNLIDFDGSFTTANKNQIGDVALYKHLCPCVRVVRQQVSCVDGLTRWTLTITNTSGFDISYMAIDGLPPGVTGPAGLVPFVPPIAVGETRTISFDFNVVAPAPAEICFNLLVHNADLSTCCAQPFCIKPERCLCVVSEKFTPTNIPGRLDYCITFTNLSGIPVTKVVFANTPVGSNCPVFLSPIVNLTPPMAPGETRTICTQIMVPSSCTSLNFVVSLHDSSYRTCCSIPRNIPWGATANPVDVGNSGLPNVIMPKVNLNNLLEDDFSAITQLVFLVDGKIERTVDTPPWELFPGQGIPAAAGDHTISYVVTTAFGTQMQGPISNVRVEGQVTPLPNIQPKFAMDTLIRDADKALILSWQDPSAKLQTTQSLSGEWETLYEAESPTVIREFSDKKRFYRLNREP